MQQTVDLDRLSLDHYRQNARLPQDSPALRMRLKEQGCLDPVQVRPTPAQPGRFDVLTNPQVVIAAGKVGIAALPVLVRDDLDDYEAAEIVRGQQLTDAGNPIAEAEWLAERLQQQVEVLGVSKPEIGRLADEVQLGRTYISRSLALLKLPQSVQDLFRDGRLSRAHGRCLAKVASRQKCERFARKAAEKSLSVRQLQELVDDAAALDTPAPVSTNSSHSGKDADTLRLEREVSAIVGSPVLLDTEAGMLTINYFGNFETLEGILERLGYRVED